MTFLREFSIRMQIEKFYNFYEILEFLFLLKCSKMEKYEKLRSSLTCHYCCLIYENPVKLPCNKSICKSHLLDSNGTFLKEFECHNCQTNHFLPMRGLHSNFYILKIIKENAHLSETELEIKIKLENSFEKLVKIYKEINKEKDLVKLQNNLSIQFRQIKINVDHLQQQFEEIENELKGLNEKSRNQSIKIITSYNDGSIAMRDIQSPTQFDFFNGKHDEGRICLLITSDNQKLISGGSDGCIKMWDLKTGLLLKSIFNFTEIRQSWKIKCMINSLQSNEILIGSTLSEIRTLDLNTFAFKPDRVFKGHLKMVKCLEFLTDEHLLSGSCDNTIKIWNFTTKQCIQTIQSDCEVKGIRKINENKFICGYENRAIRIWSLSNKGGGEEEFVCAQVVSNAIDGLYLLQFKVNLELNLAMGYSAHSICIWDLDTLNLLHRCVPNNLTQTRSFENLQNHQLLVGNANNTLELFCLKTGKSLKVTNDFNCLIHEINVYYPYLLFCFY